MSLNKELIFVNEDKLNFGNFELDKKAKKEDFEFRGDLYKIKTFKDITKLEKNGLFLYESEPGSRVSDFILNDLGLSFSVEGYKDLQISLDLEENKEYATYINDQFIGDIKTNLSGKLVIFVNLNDKNYANVRLIRK